MKKAAPVMLVLLFLFVGCSADSLRELPDRLLKRRTPTPTSTPLAIETPTRAPSPTTAPGTVVAQATATRAPSSPFPTSGVAATATMSQPVATTATKAPPTIAPTATKGPPTVAPTKTVTATTSVKLFFVALGDNGGSGKKIGCGDSLIPVNRVVAPTQDVLRAALEQLLSQHDRFYGESGLYNALYQSSLAVESFSVANGKATVRLTGTFQLGGVCDIPRIQEQLTQTIVQPHLSIANAAVIFVNGTPLETLLSLR